MRFALLVQGPSISIDTACSSALVAVHSARNDFAGHFAKSSLAAGINTILNPAIIKTLCVASMLSTSRCKALDSAADGYVRGESAVVMHLSVESCVGSVCLLRGTSVNQDGRSSSLTAPNGPSQREVIQSSWHSAGLRSSEMVSIEMHGTGTALGEPAKLVHGVYALQMRNVSRLAYNCPGADFR